MHILIRTAYFFSESHFALHCVVGIIEPWDCRYQSINRERNPSVSNQSDLVDRNWSDCTQCAHDVRRSCGHNQPWESTGSFCAGMQPTGGHVVNLNYMVEKTQRCLTTHVCTHKLHTAVSHYTCTLHTAGNKKTRCVREIALLERAEHERKALDARAALKCSLSGTYSGNNGMKIFSFSVSDQHGHPKSNMVRGGTQTLSMRERERISILQRVVRV